MNSEEIEEYAFYESGLGAHGCLENLDSYARTAIEKYGRILVQREKKLHDEEVKKYKEHLADASDHYIKILSDYAKLDDETRVEIQTLEAQLKTIEEDGTEEHNNAVELRSKLSQTLLELDNYKQNNAELLKQLQETEDVYSLKSQITLLQSMFSKTDALWRQSEERETKWKEISDKLYSVALHVEELAKSRCNIIVVGPGLYSEAVNAIKEYEELEKDNEL